MKFDYNYDKLMDMRMSSHSELFEPKEYAIPLNQLQKLKEVEIITEEKLSK